MILTDPSRLRAVCEPASAEEAFGIIAELETALKTSPIPGVGLSAPQIGITKRVAIIRTEKARADLVNPRIIDRRDIVVSKGEGCLSLPGVLVDTWRNREIVVEDDLHPHGMVAEGLEAIAILHEIDHMDGILITDRAHPGKIGRNDPCLCGAIRLDGKPEKLKRCCGR